MPATTLSPTTPELISPVAEQYLTESGNPLRRFYRKVLEGERFTRAEAIEIYNSDDLLSVGILADTMRKRLTLPEHRNDVFWTHNYHINPTNICEAHCTFCAFKKGPRSPHAYVMTIDQVVENVAKYPHYQTLIEFHIVAGLYRETGLEYYRDLFKALKQHYPHVQIKALTAVEIAYLAKIEGLSNQQVFDELIPAGMQAMPGGGAEVFAERIREQVCLDKISGEEWCEVHGLAHANGLKTNATMLAGIGENAEERVEHMLTIREQQDKSGGFLSFIPLNCYYENTKIDPSNALTGVENLKNFAVSRLVLDNVPHIKSFWIHIGEKISQVGLNFGVDDIDGTVITEKIANAAGTASGQALNPEQLLHLIRKAGKTPVLRDTFYNVVKRYDDPALDNEPIIWPLKN